MQLVTVQFELCVPDLDTEGLKDYLNDKLYTDPEFFGDIDVKNIISIKPDTD